MNIEAFMARAESLSPDTVDELLVFYAEDCEFTDPFQTVGGRAAIRNIYASMFRHLDRPCFHHIRLAGVPSHEEAVLIWDFEFALGKTKPRTTIAGSSRLLFDQQGKISRHIDYWDASALMQCLPVVGPAIGWLRRRIAHGGGPPVE